MQRPINSQGGGDAGHLLPSDILILALVALLPLMKPAIDIPGIRPDLVIAADLVFCLVVAAMAFEWASGHRRIRWQPAFAILLAYVVSLLPSLLATMNMAASLSKLATEPYLVGLAVVTIVAVRNETMLRRVTLTWLAATAALVVLGIASLAAFAEDGALYQYSMFHFGTLPPGDYPRLSLSFFNANMACNYLTVSVGLLFLARSKNWLSTSIFWVLLAGTTIIALSTLSAGLGGIALAVGVGFWLIRGNRIALVIGTGFALASAIVVAVTPIVHPTAPFLIHVPGTSLVLAPSARFMIWEAALDEFLRHPLIGHGIGVDPVAVHYMDPSGILQLQTDAHNVLLSIASQAGLIGVAGLALLTVYAFRLTLSGDRPSALIGLTFLNAFLYQGLSGAFEDTRHLWVLFGLLVASARLPATRADGSNRTAGAPSPG